MTSTAAGTSGDGVVFRRLAAGGVLSGLIFETFFPGFDTSMATSSTTYLRQSAPRDSRSRFPHTRKRGISPSPSWTILQSKAVKFQPVGLQARRFLPQETLCAFLLQPNLFLGARVLSPPCSIFRAFQSAFGIEILLRLTACYQLAVSSSRADSSEALTGFAKGPYCGQGLRAHLLGSKHGPSSAERSRELEEGLTILQGLRDLCQGE